jgi:peptidyl serine alpha-galactosyltransferase
MRKKAGQVHGQSSSGISCGSILSLVTVVILFWLGFVIYHVTITATAAPPAPVPPPSPLISKTNKNTIEAPKDNSFPLTPPREVPLQTQTHHITSTPPPSPPPPSLQNKEPKVHVVFSTDCGTFQDWQTLVFFYSARVIQQQGMVTRIASGCSLEKQTSLLELYSRLFPEYSVHFTPDYSKDQRTGQKYHFYNKPYGVLHWIEHASPPISPGTIVAICDPDFIFLRPLTAQLHSSNTLTTLWTMNELDQIKYVQQGHPAAQQYGLGAPWVNDAHLKFNRTFICGENSPCRRVPDQQSGGKAYSVGPPYMVEVTDLHRLTATWCEFVPRVYVKYPYLLAEMYGYSMAAAHEGLPHLTVDHHMVSEVNAYGEGWQWIDELGDDVCRPPDAQGVFYPSLPMPTFIHYCQAYRIDEVGYGKRRVPHDIFSCASPMLLEPNPQIAHSRSFIQDNKVLSLDAPSPLLFSSLSHPSPALSLTTGGVEARSSSSEAECFCDLHRLSGHQQRCSVLQREYVRPEQGDRQLSENSQHICPAIAAPRDTRRDSVRKKRWAAAADGVDNNAMALPFPPLPSLVLSRLSLSVCRLITMSRLDSPLLTALTIRGLNNIFDRNISTARGRVRGNTSQRPTNLRPRSSNRSGEKLSKLSRDLIDERQRQRQRERDGDKEG